MCTSGWCRWPAEDETMSCKAVCLPDICAGQLVHMSVRKAVKWWKGLASSSTLQVRSGQPGQSKNEAGPRSTGCGCACQCPGQDTCSTGTC